MSATELLQVQIGRETVWGTPVTPTWKLLGVDKNGVKFTPEFAAPVYHDQRGSLAPGYISVVEKVGGTVSITGMVLYEDIGLLLDAAFGRATATGAGPYTRAYTGPTTAVTTPSIFTILWGQGTETWKAEGCVLTSLQIEGQTNAPVKYTAEFSCQQVTAGTLAALSDRTVVPVMGNHASVFVDAFGGTIGTTALTSTALGFNLNISPSRVIKYYMGSVIPGAYEDATWALDFQITLEMNSTVKGYFDTVFAATPATYTRLFRVKFDDTANRSLTLDSAVALTEAPAMFNDNDGVVTVDMKFSGLVDTGTFANFLKATSINGVALNP